MMKDTETTKRNTYLLTVGDFSLGVFSGRTELDAVNAWQISDEYKKRNGHPRPAEVDQLHLGAARLTVTGSGDSQTRTLRDWINAINADTYGDDWRESFSSAEDLMR
tara:strand:- start:197 stop:517 length:321 start_codon:yes stop_codon:yes gene_type:complete